jgi:hypothetical protein
MIRKLIYNSSTNAKALLLVAVESEAEGLTV